MITRVRLANFKAFADQSLTLQPLTLLAGLNGMGKSSVLQSLLLLRQSYQDFANAAPGVTGLGLNLRGQLVQLGKGSDILFEGTNEEIIIIELDFESRYLGREIHTLNWAFKYNHDATQLEQENTPASITYNKTPTFVFSFCSLFQDNFQYLQAERFGPRTILDTSYKEVIRHKQIGTRGEFAAHFLHEFQNQSVELTSLHHPEAVSFRLIDQVVAWLDKISPGTRLHTDLFAGIDAAQLSFSFVRGNRFKDTTSKYRAANVGFGISYILPILLAILSSRPDTLILLENPEAHLHPRGQVMIGELMARAAASGIQILVETHSDHVLNGIRIAAKRGYIDPDKVALHFFQRPEDEEGISSVEVITPKLDSDGRIDKWPRFFFDEWDYSLNELL